jgi:hypothetical protein
MRARTFTCLWFVVLVGLAGAGPVAAESPFERAWREAGDGEASKLEALKLLEAEASTRAAKILLNLAMSSAEPPAVSAAALAHLAALEGTEADAWIVAEAKGAKRWEVRSVLVRAIGRREGDAATEVLMGALSDRVWQVQAAALPGLAPRREAKVVEALIGAMEALKPSSPESPRIAAEMEDTLFRITGERFQGGEAWRRWWEAVAPAWTPPEGEAELVEHDEATITRAPRLFRDVEAATRRVAFVVDVSGSMKVPTPAGIGEGGGGGATRFQVMVQELKSVVERLPREARFNIIAFGDEAQPWAPKLQRATGGTRRKATSYLDRLRPDGQTNVIAALEQAFADESVDTIYLLSDGFPTAGRTVDFTKIQQEVGRWNLTRGVRIHTIAFLSGDGKGLGIVENKSMSRTFMRDLAQAHGGRFRVIE